MTKFPQSALLVFNQPFIVNYKYRGADKHAFVLTRTIAKSDVTVKPGADQKILSMSPVEIIAKNPNLYPLDNTPALS